VTKLLVLNVALVEKSFLQKGVPQAFGCLSKKSKKYPVAPGIKIYFYTRYGHFFLNIKKSSIIYQQKMM